MDSATLDALPGFRRRFRVTPSEGSVIAAVEDDYHCMAVTLRHDGTRVTGVESVMERVPWTTCPGAPAVLAATFTGVALTDVAARGEKKTNCTHLHDLAVLAAAHAADDEPILYDLPPAIDEKKGRAGEGRRAPYRPFAIRRAGCTGLSRWSAGPSS